ncbi:predicted protein [Naegleria gruberi]|uniref:Predicted protein n=1 Tax=Naegleria gruberi TaxID=5762 RepID=D2VVF4_NAEGR|nr:uncharacterized protein NAEGRDRAFT_72999 [Naegleria gruberi]EFC39227.1 predicted protein [Naegleria gruberi]|eukprot:XP_002671971.1 predicted protein [Naegleria gruberi strain NEG-M]
MKRKIDQLLSVFSKKKKKEEKSSDEQANSSTGSNELRFEANNYESCIGTLCDTKIVLNIMKFLEVNEILFNICCTSQSKDNSREEYNLDIKPLYLVCKFWFKIIQSEEFSRNYLLIYHNLVNHRRIKLFNMSEMDLTLEKIENVYKQARLTLIQDGDEPISQDFYQRLMMLRGRLILHNSNEYLEYLTRKVADITRRNKITAKKNVKDWTEPFDDLNEFIEMISQNSHNNHARMSFASNLYTQFLNLGYAGDCENPIEDPEVQQIFKHLRKWKLSCLITQSSREILEMRFSNSLFCTFENDNLREYVLFRDDGEPLKLTSNNEGIMINEVFLLKVVEDRKEGEDMFYLNKSFPYNDFLGYTPNQDEKEFILSFFTFFATNGLVSNGDEDESD